MPIPPVKHRTTQRGFTLVEMTIVLVIIGLIIGAVAIGKDVVRNAEYQKVGNKFIYEWKKTYDQYYQRTGVRLGDSQVAPTGMVNGNETQIGGQPASSGNLNGAVAGLPENYTNTGLRICHGQGYAQNSVGTGDPGLAVQRTDAAHRYPHAAWTWRGQGRSLRIHGHEWQCCRVAGVFPVESSRHDQRRGKCDGDSWLDA